MLSLDPLPSIAVTLGDLEGVGGELAVKVALSHVQKASPTYQLAFYGDIQTCDMQADALGLKTLSQLATAYPRWIRLHDTPASSSGEASFNALALATQDALKGNVLGIATAPISKANWWKAQIRYSGHTEALEALVNQNVNQYVNQYAPSQGDYACQADMFFVYQQFRLLLLTRHVPLQAVGASLNLNEAKQSITALLHALRRIEPKPLYRLALLGVNPHAGEIGGMEEAEVLLPLCEWVKKNVPDAEITLPQPADAFFRGFDAQSAKGFDAVISPYHDQGLIPMKLLGGFQAVNVTLGLPFIRTSVSHGMASDIAGLGIANPESLESAIRYIVASIISCRASIRCRYDDFVQSCRSVYTPFTK